MHHPARPLLVRMFRTFDAMGGSAQRRRALASTAALGLAVLLAGCSGSTTNQVEKAVSVPFDAKNFDQPATGRNPYLPLRPGSQFVRSGTTLVGGRAVPHQVTTTITDVYRVVDGVKTVLMLDHEVDGGQVSQVSLDYAAEDKNGNVWILGGYTEEYEGGRMVNATDEWLAGVHGSKPGIVVQADPKVSTPLYTVAQPAGADGDVAEVIEVGAKRCVPFDCFNNVLVVREGKASEPDNEFKYYALHVGQIDNVPRGASRHKDVEQLVNLTHLDRAGLTEFSKEALKLDRHAVKDAPQIYGTKAATRG